MTDTVKNKEKYPDLKLPYVALSAVDASFSKPLQEWMAEKTNDTVEDLEYFNDMRAYGQELKMRYARDLWQEMGVASLSDTTAPAEEFIFATYFDQKDKAIFETGDSNKPDSVSMEQRQVLRSSHNFVELAQNTDQFPPYLDATKHHDINRNVGNERARQALLNVDDFVQDYYEVQQSLFYMQDGLHKDLLALPFPSYESTQELLESGLADFNKNMQTIEKIREKQANYTPFYAISEYFTGLFTNNNADLHSGMGPAFVPKQAQIEARAMVAKQIYDAVIVSPEFDKVCQAQVQSYQQKIDTIDSEMADNSTGTERLKHQQKQQREQLLLLRDMWARKDIAGVAQETGAFKKDGALDALIKKMDAEKINKTRETKDLKNALVSFRNAGNEALQIQGMLDVYREAHAEYQNNPALSIARQDAETSQGAGLYNLSQLNNQIAISQRVQSMPINGTRGAITNAVTLMTERPKGMAIASTVTADLSMLGIFELGGVVVGAETTAGALVAGTIAAGTAEVLIGTENMEKATKVGIKTFNRMAKVDDAELDSIYKETQDSAKSCQEKLHRQDREAILEEACKNYSRLAELYPQDSQEYEQLQKMACSMQKKKELLRENEFVFADGVLLEWPAFSTLKEEKSTWDTLKDVSLERLNKTQEEGLGESLLTLGGTPKAVTTAVLDNCDVMHPKVEQIYYAVRDKTASQLELSAFERLNAFNSACLRHQQSLEAEAKKTPVQTGEKATTTEDKKATTTETLSQAGEPVLTKTDESTGVNNQLNSEASHD